jgi:Outer membrane protein beta-barrel domain
MKKVFFIICVFLLSFNSNYAQSKFRLGFNGGLNYSSYRGNWVVEENDPGFGFLGGLSLEYKFKNHLSILSNLSYETKVITRTAEAIPASPDDPYVNVDVTNTHSYLVLPVLAKYSFGKNDSFFVSGGPFAAYLLNAVTKARGVPDSDNTKNEKAMDFGLTLGLGKAFKLNNNQEITIEIRENLGLTNVSAVKVVDNGTVKSNSLNLICGYSFDLK